MAAKQEIVYGSGKEAGFIFFPLKGEGVYAEMALQKDGKYKPTGNLLSEDEVQKRVSKSAKPIKTNASDSKVAVKINTQLSSIAKSIEKSTASLPDEKKLNDMLNSVSRQVAIGDKIIPAMVSAIGKISSALNKAGSQIRNMEKDMVVYSDPTYVKRQLMKFNVAVAKKDNEIAQIDLQRSQLDKSSPRYSTESAALDLKEAMAMNKFATTVGKMTDPLLNLRRSITTRVDAMTSTIKSVVNSVNKITNLQVPNVDSKTLRQIGVNVNKVYRGAFRVLSMINSGMSVEVLKAKMGWVDSGVNKYVTVTKTDENGNPYKVFLTKKEYDEKTGVIKDVKIENPDWYAPHFQAEDAMFMVSSFITKVMDLTNNINKLGNYKINSPIKTSIKMRMLARSIKRLVGTVAKSFSDIDSVGIRYAISTLVGSETNITTTNTSQSPEGVVDQINSVMTTKQPGVVSAIAALMGSIKCITDMDFGPITLKSIKARIKLRLAGRSVKKLVNTLVTTFPSSKEVDPKNGVDYALIYDNAMQMSQAVAMVRDQFGQINEEIMDLSEMVIKGRYARRAKRRIRSAIRKYSMIFDVVIEELDRKKIAEKRDMSRELLQGMVEDLSVVVTLVDKMGALKDVSKKAIRHKKRLRLIRETLIEFRDMISDIANGYNPEDLVVGKNMATTVSGLLPVFITDMLYVINKAEKLTGKEEVVDEIMSVIRKYTEITSDILSIMPLYRDMNPKDIVLGNRAITLFIKGLPNINAAYEMIAELGKKAGVKKTEFDSAIRILTIMGEMTTILVTMGEKKAEVRKGSKSMARVISTISLFTPEVLDRIKETAGAKKDVETLKVIITTLVDISELLNHVKFGKGRYKTVSLAISNISSILTKIDKTFNKKRRDSINESNKTLVAVKGLIGELVLISLELTALAILSIPAAIGALGGALVLVTLGVMMKSLKWFVLMTQQIKGFGKNTKKKLLQTAAIIGVLILIETELVVAGVLALPAALGALAASLVIVALAGLVLRLNIVLSLANSLGKRDRKTMTTLTLILGELVLIELELIAIGLFAIPALIGALGAVLVLGVMIQILIILDRFKAQIALGALALLAVNGALLVTAYTFAVMSKLLADWDWMMLLKIPSMVLAMALPFTIIGIPVVAGLTALGSLVMLLVAYTYKKIIETVAEMGKLDIDTAKSNISGVTEVIKAMTEGMSPKNIKAFASVAAGVTSVSNTVNSYAKMLGLIQKIAEMKVPTGYDSDGKPTGWKAADKSVFENAKTAINNITDVMKHIFDKLDEMAGDGREGIRTARRGKNIAKKIARTIKPINKILNFIVKLSSSEYELPIYGTALMMDGEKPVEVETNKIQKVNLAEFLRTQEPVILNTIDSMFNIIDKIQDRMTDMAGDGNENKRHVRRGKNIIKKIKNTIKPINKILNFIRELSDEYELPIYSVADGLTTGGETIDGKRYISGGIQKVNLAEFLRTQEPIILKTVDSMFNIVDEIGKRVNKFATDEDKEHIGRGKRRLKKLNRAMGPVNEILNFIKDLSGEYTYTAYTNIGTEDNPKFVIDESVGEKGLMKTNIGDYIRSQRPVIDNTITTLFGFVDEIAERVTKLGEDKEEGKNVVAQTRKGKRRLKVVNRALGPINDILNFIKDLSGNTWTLPTYNEEFAGTMDGPMPVYNIDPTGKTETLSIAEYIRTNKGTIMTTIGDMFDFMDEIADRVYSLGEKEGKNAVPQTRKGKRRLKVISQTAEPINDILTFIRGLAETYTLPMYIEDGNGGYKLDESIKEEGLAPGYKKRNLGEYIRESEKPIIDNIKSMFTLIDHIGANLVNLGGGFVDTNKWSKREAKKAGKQLKLIQDTVQPLNDILKFITDLEGGYVDVPKVENGEYVKDENGNIVTKPLNIKDLVKNANLADGTVKTLIDIVGQIGNTIQEYAKQKDSGISNVSEKNVQKVMMITDVVNPIIDYVNLMYTMKEKNKKILGNENEKESLYSTTTHIVKSVNKMFNLEILTTSDGNFKSKASRLETLYKRVKDFSELKAASGFKEAVTATEDMVAAIDAINDTKIDKLNTLMVNMTKFGETVDETLKDVFDKIVELAEELHYIIEADLRKNDPEEYKRQKEQEKKEQQAQNNQNQNNGQQQNTPRVDISGIENSLGTIEQTLSNLHNLILTRKTNGWSTP